MAWLSKNNFTPSDNLHADDMNNLSNDIMNWGGDVNGGGHHLSNVIIDPYYPGPGVAEFSPLHVIPTSTDYSAQLRLDSEAGGNPPRWILIKDATTESGANAGSNLQLEACDDTGNIIHTPISIVRSTGVMTLGQQIWSGNVNGGGFTLSNVVLPGVFSDPTTTKGDIVGRGAAAPAVRIPVGADGTTLQADSTQPLGVKWATSPAVPTSTQVIAGAGLAGGGALTGNVTLTNAGVLSFNTRTGAITLSAADITGATGVINTRSVLAGAGMSGGGQLTADVTLNALVTSVFGRTGAVVLTAADVSAGGGVPAARQVIAGTGMSGGGALSSDVTLNAAVISVFGRTGSIVLNQGDIVTAGGVANTRQVITAVGSGLAGGGPLSADLNLSVVSNTSVQKVNVFSNVAVGNPGSPVSTESGINFIPGNSNTTITIADEPANNRANITITNTGSTAIWTTRGATTTLIGNRPGINLIEGSNVTFSGVDNSTSNRVDITVSAVGGTGGGASQTPWLTNVDAAGYNLANVAYQGINSAVDITTRLALQLTGTELAIRAANSSAANAARIEADNDNATAKIQLVSHGSSFGGTLQGTGGLNAAVGGMTFSIADVEAMRVSVGKHLLVGTNTDDGVEMVQVNGKIKSLTGGIVFPDGTVQTTAITSTGMNDPTTTLGDLIVRGSTVTGRLGVGTNGQVLVANSVAAMGINWVSPNALSGVQSPWVADEDAANHKLLNVNRIGIGTSSPTVSLDIQGNPYAYINISSLGSTAPAGRYQIVPDAFAIYLRANTATAGDFSTLLNIATFNTSSAAFNAIPGSAETVNIISGDGAIQAILQGYSYSSSQGYGLTFASNSARGTSAAPTPSQQNDFLGRHIFNGYTSTNGWTTGAQISSLVEQNWGATAAYANLIFYTASGGGAAERMRLTGAGQVLIGQTAGNGTLAALQVTAPATATSAFDVTQTIGTGRANVTFINASGSSDVTNKMRLRLGPAAAFAGTDVQPYIESYIQDTAYNAGLALGTKNASGVLEAMRINFNQQVSIGSLITPGARLNVVDSGTFQLNLAATDNQWGLVFQSYGASAPVSGYGGPNNAAIVQYFNAPMVFATANVERMRIMGNGNVGIGTTNPGANLDVHGGSGVATLTSTATGIAQVLLQSNNQNWFFQNRGNLDAASGPSFNRFALYGPTSNECMTVLTNGLVGIGTASPAYQLDILSNNATQLRLQTAAGSGSQIYLGAGQAGAGGVIQFAATTANANAVCLGNSLPGAAVTNDFVFGTFTTAGGWAERMRILGAGNGNVGIGSSAPVTRLEVCVPNGNTGINVTTSQASYGLLIGQDAASQSASVYHGPNYGYVINVLNAPLILGANNLANVTILPSGNVGIGTVSPAYTLDLGNGSLGGIGLRVNNAAGGGTRLTINGGTTNFTISNSYFTTNAFEIHDDTNIASRLVILPSGNLGINKAAPAYALDVTGDCNISGTYRVNGVALSTGGAPGAWLSYTPTVTDNVGTAMATSSLTAHYVVFGSILFIQIVFVVTMTANSGAINFTLPVTAVADSNNVTCYAAWGSGTQNQAVIASGNSGTSIKITMGAFSNGVSLQLYIGGSLRIS